MFFNTWAAPEAMIGLGEMLGAVPLQRKNPSARFPAELHDLLVRQTLDGRGLLLSRPTVNKDRGS